MTATPNGKARITVTPDNFIRAESDMYFTGAVKIGGFGKFVHRREPVRIDQQDVVRLNRDTLYSEAIFDLHAGPVTVTMPDPGERFMSLMVLDEDEYVYEVVYGGGSNSYNQDEIPTRYIAMAVRTLVDPENPEDVKKVHALQDAIRVSQAGTGEFNVPDWDPASQKKIREALLALGANLQDTRGFFGRKDEVDPVHHLIGAATAWGGNPAKDATYLNVVPTRNNGTTVYRLRAKDVPVDGFWSVSVYNAKGYYEPNVRNAYSINNITAKKDEDGGVTIQFGGCDGTVPNCLPIVPGWNYLVRLYRPRRAILDGEWKFPEAQPVH